MHANLRETTLRSIARLEVAGEREPRLTEPDHARWHRFRLHDGRVRLNEPYGLAYNPDMAAMCLLAEGDVAA